MDHQEIMWKVLKSEVEKRMAVYTVVDGLLYWKEQLIVTPPGDTVPGPSCHEYSRMYLSKSKITCMAT